MTKSVKLGLLAATSLSLIPLMSHAQTAATSADSNQVQEVVVTAQKRTEALVNVPISIVAVSGSRLEDAGVTDMGSLGNVVPGLHIDQSGANFQPSIRGVGSALSGPSFASNIAIYVDGVYRPNQLNDDFNFIDIDSVQVLKGPQGTLFGRNATGGAIVVTTKAPSFEPVIEMRAGYGSFNTFTGGMYASDKITDKLAMSLSLGASHSDGWTDNLATGQGGNVADDFAGRAKLLYLPNDGMKFTLIVDAYKTNDPTQYAVSPYKGASEAALYYGVPITVGSPTKIDAAGVIAHNTEGGGVELKSEFDLGFATLTSYSAGHWDSGQEGTNEEASAFPANGTAPLPSALNLIGATNNGSGAPNASPVIATSANWLVHEQTYSQEFDLGQSNKGPIDWVTGLYYFYDTTTYSPFNLGLYGPFGAGGAYQLTGDQAFWRTKGISYSGAVFADATYNWGQWHFTAGGRYSIDRAGAIYADDPTLANGFSTFRGSANHDYYAFTPRVILKYSLTPSSNVYISWSKGKKAGLYNVTGFKAQSTPLSPENITDIEGGYKITGHSWRLEASAYHYDYKNLQVASYVGGTSILQNARAAEIYGGDIHFQQRFMDHYMLDIGGAYTHARYTDFASAVDQIFCSTVCAVPGAPAGVTSVGFITGTKNVKNGAMERTPDFTGYVSLEYNTDAWGGTIDLFANYSYQTKSSFDIADSLIQPAYGLLTLRAAWTDPSKKWTFSAEGRNVTNETYLSQILPNGGALDASYAEPANFMLKVDYRFH